MVSKIKQGIYDLLSNISKLEALSEKEIIKDVKKFSKSKTPERSINRTLNELYADNILEKYYFDKELKEYDEGKPNKKPKYYKFPDEPENYIRAVLSIDEYIFCGSNARGSNPYRKEPFYIDVKVWTFVDQAKYYQMKYEVEEFLRSKLVEYLHETHGECYHPEYPDMYVKEIPDLDYYAYDDSQAVRYEKGMKIFDDYEIEDNSKGQ